MRYADAVDATANDKQVAPSADRNKAHVLEVLQKYLAPFLEAAVGQCTLLEVASGTGQHAAHLVDACGGLTLQPTDAEATALRSIAAYARESPHPSRFLPPLKLDVREAGDVERVLASPHAPFTALLCCNMVHIAPPECTPSLVSLAGRALPPGGLFFLYGPFLVDGRPTTDSNAAFDAKLKGMDALYGLKDVALVAGLAKEAGLDLDARLDMPANNFMLIFRKV